MLIGIDASRAFLKKRTGIEEYSYQVIKHLRQELESEQVVLYVKKNFEFRISNFESNSNLKNSELKIQSKFRIQNFRFIRGVKIGWRMPQINFDLPKNWIVKGIWAPRFWTQIGLSLEMLLHRPDVLFVPAHTVPFVHPKKTIVTIHGLEYEFCKGAYSLYARLYMRFFIKFSCRAASTVICVSENTKKDVMRLYGVTEEKIRVVYEGYDNNFELRNANSESNSNIQNSKIESKFEIQNSQLEKPYLLFIGRLEERKNIVRIIETFEILKEKYGIPHTLVLVGKPGYGYEKIRTKIQDSRFKIHVKEVGYVTEEEKWELLKNADAFLFPTLYEGFGIPVLEAQSVGVPVVTSSVSSLPEVGGRGAVYVDPLSVESIVEGIQKVLSDKELRDDIIEKGLENTRRFSWNRCAGEIAKLLKSN